MLTTMENITQNFNLNFLILSQETSQTNLARAWLVTMIYYTQ